MMTDPGQYERAHESRRLGAVVAISCVVLIFGVSIGVRLGVAGIVLIVVLVVAVGTLLFGFVRRPVPDFLTTMTLGERDGVWPCSVALFNFPAALQRRPNTRNTVEVLGTVRFMAEGVRWDPTDRTAAFFGISPVIFGPDWMAQARRLRGPAGPVQLTMSHRASGESVTLWLRRAGKLTIP